MYTAAEGNLKVLQRYLKCLNISITLEVPISKCYIGIYSELSYLFPHLAHFPHFFTHFSSTSFNICFQVQAQERLPACTHYFATVVMAQNVFNCTFPRLGPKKRLCVMVMFMSIRETEETASATAKLLNRISSSA